MIILENIHLNFKLFLLSLISTCFGGIFILVIYKAGYLNIQYFTSILLFIVGYAIGVFVTDKQTN